MCIAHHELESVVVITQTVPFKTKVMRSLVRMHRVPMPKEHEVPCMPGSMCNLQGNLPGMQVHTCSVMRDLLCALVLCFTLTAQVYRRVSQTQHGVHRLNLACDCHIKLHPGCADRV